MIVRLAAVATWFGSPKSTGHDFIFIDRPAFSLFSLETIGLYGAGPG